MRLAPECAGACHERRCDHLDYCRHHGNDDAVVEQLVHAEFERLPDAAGHRAAEPESARSDQYYRFTSQLMSYANFEQQQTLNSNLSSLSTSFNSLLTLNSSNYIGQTVTAKADSATLENGSISFGYSLNSAAKNVTLTVSDSSGNTVWTGSGTTTAGSNSFNWDGTTTNGTQLSDGGSYSLSVTATDSSGSSVYGYTTVCGKVTAVDNSSGTTMLKIGNTSAASAASSASRPRSVGVLT